MRRARRLLSLPVRRDIKRILSVVAAATAFAAIGAVPAMASQAAPAQPAQASHSVRQQISFGASLEDGSGLFVAPTPNGAQFSISNVHANFTVYLLGLVNPTTGWPFSDHHFDRLYAGDSVYTFDQNGSGGGCMQTDSVHSGVVDKPCGAHNAGTYWAAVGSGTQPACIGASWLVNVGITNHYDPYPYGSAMFANTNALLYTQSHRPISANDQWCLI